MINYVGFGVRTIGDKSRINSSLAGALDKLKFSL